MELGRSKCYLLQWKPRSHTQSIHFPRGLCLELTSHWLRLLYLSKVTRSPRRKSCTEPWITRDTHFAYSHGEDGSVPGILYCRPYPIACRLGCDAPDLRIHRPLSGCRRSAIDPLSPPGPIPSHRPCRHAPRRASDRSADAGGERMTPQRRWK